MKKLSLQSYICLNRIERNIYNPFGCFCCCCLNLYFAFNVPNIKLTLRALKTKPSLV